MARKPRIEYPGAIYHVMSRGNRQETIFRDDRDCGVFLDTLGEACAKTGWLVHAFVLMGNHYHLLLETPEPNLVAGMKWLQGTHTQRFNSRHKLWGHLLQGRYKALLVDGSSGGYFPAAGNYIHLNPARARQFDLETGNLADYGWSSFPLYLRPSKRPPWLVVERLLGSLGVRDDRQGREWYRRHMRKRVGDIASSRLSEQVTKEWADIRKGWCLGSEAFRDELLERLGESLKGCQRSSHSGDEIRQHNEAEAERILSKGLKCLGLTNKSLSSLPKGSKEKAMLVWHIRKHATVSRQWLAKRLALGDESRVSKMSQDVERGKSYVELRKAMMKIHDSRTDP